MEPTRVLEGASDACTFTWDLFFKNVQWPCPRFEDLAHCRLRLERAVLTQNRTATETDGTLVALNLNRDEGNPIAKNFCREPPCKCAVVGRFGPQWLITVSPAKLIVAPIQVLNGAILPKLESLAPRDLAGVSIGKPEKKMGQQGAHIHDINFDNVRVPAENRLGEENQGFRIAMQVLDRGRLHISSVCVGVAERLIEESVRYAAERKQFGQAIASFQMIQAMLADCRAEANAGRAMVLEAARKRDGGGDVTMDAAAAKLFCSEMVGRVADRAVQIFGGSGYVADYGIERFYRDVRIFRLYEGTSEIQRLIIAREMMKQGR